MQFIFESASRALPKELIMSFKRSDIMVKIFQPEIHTRNKLYIDAIKIYKRKNNRTLIKSLNVSNVN